MRFACLGDQRFWRADLPDGTTSAYGVLEAIARNKVNTKKVFTQWPDMLRVAGSLVTDALGAESRFQAGVRARELGLV
ncbi:Tn3 family transposase [Nonomuraea sp. GTA35]